MSRCLGLAVITPEAQEKKSRIAFFFYLSDTDRPASPAAVSETAIYRVNIHARTITPRPRRGFTRSRTVYGPTPQSKPRCRPSTRRCRLLEAGKVDMLMGFSSHRRHAVAGCFGPCRPVKKFHVDHHRHVLRRVRQRLQIRPPPASGRDQYWPMNGTKTDFIAPVFES